MAESVLIAIAEAVLEKLGSLTAQEIQLWCCVENELEKLERTVLTIQAVLRDADKQPTMSDQVKNYIDNLKEVLYDADDLLDDLSTEALRKQVMSGNKVTCWTMLKEVCIFFSPSNQLFCGLKMAHEIKAIREKLDAIKDDKKFHIGDGALGKPVVTRGRETGSCIGEKEVIGGRDVEKVKFVELLKGSNLKENVCIITIVGMGGLGKTALARLVYNDNEVDNHFEKKFWVCVSDVFNLSTIIKGIVVSGTDRELGNLTINQLQNLLRKELDGKKYLLVLDDVWEDSLEWGELEKLLTGGAKGSWIVVTTRFHQVAKMISPVDEPYVLKGLSEADSWALFARKAFGQGNDPTNQSIEAIGKEIVKMCAGVPLAITVMGSLLSGESDIEYWTCFKNKISKSPQLEERISSTLKLSYNNLEPQLKNCFAYCRLFAKDHTFDVKNLIYLWIAQGFIKSSKNSSPSLEQIGYYDFFLVLLGRCFFQEPTKDEWGKIVSCKMHDLMHDLAVEVAGSESIILGSGKEINVPRNTRHVFIESTEIESTEIPYDLLEANNIRTFMCNSCPSYEEVCAIVSNFKRVRTLDLPYGGSRRLPESIGELKHIRYLNLYFNSKLERLPRSIAKLQNLRYLNLSWNCQLEILPSSVSRLQNLLVLDLFYCQRLKELPEDIKNLVSLEHLDIDGCDSLTHMPQGLEQLTSLQTLTRFIVSKDDSVSKHHGGLNELNRLNNLRGKLSLENLEYVKNDFYKAANLEGKEHLQSLILKWGGYYGVENVDYFDFDGMSMEALQPHKNLKQLHVSGYPGERSPYGLSSLTNLVSLKLSRCGKVKHLPPLDGLSSLRDLSIDNFSDLEYIDCNRWSSNCSRASFFSCLKKLEIKDCPNLKGWRIGSMETSTTKLLSFPCLSKLNIKSCPNLISMPLFPSIDGDLKVRWFSGKPLEDTMMMNSMAASMLTSSSSSSPPLPLSKLKSLEIGGIDDLEYLPDHWMRNLTSLENLRIDFCGVLLSLAGEWLRGLNSLRSLEISYCWELRSISEVFQHCTALKELEISSCDELDFSDDMSCEGLRSLSSLKILHLPKPVSLPRGLQHVTTLQALHIKKCNNFTTLPDWIGSLTSLQTLWISDCSKVTSLPEGMHRLTSLRELTILKCSQLSERCRNNTGVDWPKISHIANIEVDDRQIQLGGCYQLDSTDSESES